VRRLAAAISQHRQAIAIVSVVLLLHLVLPFIPHLPSYTVNSDSAALISGTEGQFLTAETAILGAALVAFFFALTSLQQSHPLMATVWRAFRELEIEPIICFFAVPWAGWLYPSCGCNQTAHNSRGLPQAWGSCRCSIL